jgi:pimeloyl-ACP methyl ester carboxylesterase
MAAGFAKGKMRGRGSLLNRGSGFRSLFPDLAEKRRKAFCRPPVLMPSVVHGPVLILSAMLLCQCGAPSPPQCHRVPMASRVPAATLLAEARRNWSILGNPSMKDEWTRARSAYNAAVAKLFDQLRCGPDGWDTRAAAIGTRIAPSGPLETDLTKLDVLFPASDVNGHVVREHRTTDGIGVPLVGWKKTSPVGMPREKFLLPNGLPYNITATLAFDGPGAPVWHLAKRWKQDDVSIGGTSHDLAADWTAPNAFYWKMCELDDLKIQNVILPDRFLEETGVYFVTPYDQEKIPLVFVHGLVSSPDAFKNMINELSPEPWFRENYQIWLYNYPTGNPWPLSAMNFRDKMREACAYARTKGHDRNLNRMVVVAHSMGGLLTRSSVTRPQRVMYDGVFAKPIDQLRVSASTRGLIEKGLLYQPLAEPGRVVFLAVPHRGSPMATYGPSRWISSLIRLPKTLSVELLDQTLLAAGDVLTGGEGAKSLPTSINSLSPNDRFTKALDKLPLPPDTAFHSIIGDRGKGDTPASSDGVVPYWSSHVTPVASEKIVPSNHSVPDNPQAAAELKRILKLHLQSKNRNTEKPRR